MGVSLIEGGMIGSAFGNGILAGSVDYNSECDKVRDARKHISDVNRWVKNILTQEESLCNNISHHIDELETITKNLRVTIKKHNEIFKQKLHRDEIISSMICGLVSMFLLYKLLIRHDLL